MGNSQSAYDPYNPYGYGYDYNYGQEAYDPYHRWRTFGYGGYPSYGYSAGYHPNDYYNARYSSPYAMMQIPRYYSPYMQQPYYSSFYNQQPAMNYPYPRSIYL